jgi:hypothetical protein
MNYLRPTKWVSISVFNSLVLVIYHCSLAQNRGVAIYITHLRKGPQQMFDVAGITKLLGPDAFYENVADAIACAQRLRWRPNLS